jgi:hypothetical protein
VSDFPKEEHHETSNDPPLNQDLLSLALGPSTMALKGKGRRIEVNLDVVGREATDNTAAEAFLHPRVFVYF